MTKIRPRLALIGISGYGRIHLQLARECRDRGEADIVAATVINPAEETENIAALRADGCTVFSDFREMLREFRGRIDLCLIPTGIHWHARMTIAALEAGANVLVEKPLAASTAEVVAIRSAEAKSGRFVAVGFQDFYEPGTAWLRSELQRGAIGTIRSVRFLGLWPRHRAYFTRNDWAGRLQRDGVPVLDSPLNNAFSHFAMLSLYFAAAPGAPAARATLDGVELFRAHAIDSFDTCVVTAHTADGTRLWFGASHAGGETIEPEIDIVGTKGTACWRYESEAWWRATDGTSARQPLLDAPGARRAMMEAALQRLQDRNVPICTSEMAGSLAALVESVHHSAPIQSIPVPLVQWRDLNGLADAVPEVAGMIESLRRAFRSEKSLAAEGFPPHPARASAASTPVSPS
ncbi:MAG TPA: Gfo/Idh/MocA family oxidoreductase [Candidatus Didemnitutus sp.]|nr:Gfo/Idh/MocA family oxidoreductase [Candidatus Didemnitutus sp.]